MNGCSFSPVSKCSGLSSVRLVPSPAMPCALAPLVPGSRDSDLRRDLTAETALKRHPHLPRCFSGRSEVSFRATGELIAMSRSGPCVSLARHRGSARDLLEQWCLRWRWEWLTEWHDPEWVNHSLWCENDKGSGPDFYVPCITEAERDMGSSSARPLRGTQKGLGVGALRLAGAEFGWRARLALRASF